MQLTPREVEKLMVYTWRMSRSDVATEVKLNYPEAVAIITVTALEGARDGKTVEDVMKEAATVLTKADVMEGVDDLIPNVQVEAIFTDGSRLVTVHNPIK